MSNNTRVKTILVLAVNPTNTSRLRLDKEVSEIDEGLRRANKRERFKLEQKWAVRSRDFYRAILDSQPQIVHFCGHGGGEDGIVLEDETGQAAFVRADALSSMFKLFAVKGVECVLLNACYSEVQAEAISQHINYVIGMNQAIGDKAAINFAVAFYDALGAGEEVEFAFELGCSQLVGLKEHQTPVLKKKLIHPVSIEIEPEVILPPNPYQGLSAFQEQDAQFFFGQETFVECLVQATRKQPLVAVMGPSGSGKSSVVFAGLISQLRMEETWLIESFRPGKQPFDELAYTLVRQLEPELGKTEQVIKTAKLAESLKKGEITLQQVTSRILQHNPNKNLLLVADQFEELYTLCQIKEEQERFVDTLLAAIHQTSLTLVLTLRADFYSYVLSYRPFRDVLQQFTPQLLSSMSREELQTAIEQPAQKLEVQLEAHLTERILDDVGQEPGNLPLLEFALTRLWEKQQNRVLTHQAYDEIGGVKKALANHAERVYCKLSETEQKQAQRIFLQLVRLGEGTEDTRQLATSAEVGEENWGLVTYLAGYKARLVVTGRNEQSGEETVEVVHEALIREWQRLRGWIDENRDKLKQQRKIEAAAKDWRDQRKSKDYLLQGKRLTQAKVFRQEYSNTYPLSPLAEELIRESLKQKRCRQFQAISFLVIPVIAVLAVLEPRLREEVIGNDIAIINKEGGAGKRQALERLVKGCWIALRFKWKPNYLSERLFGNCRPLNQANLTGSDLSGANLSGANLSHANFTKANIRSANLTGVDLSGANLTEAYLWDANLTKAYLWGADFTKANLHNVNLNGASLGEANLTEADFNGANLMGANFTEANLTGANLMGTNLTKASFNAANLRGARLDGANLSDAKLSSADLFDTNLRGANLSGANLSSGNYYGNAKLGGAKLKGSLYNKETKFPQNFVPTNQQMHLIGPNVNLSGADLISANFSDVNLSGANLSSALLAGANFSGANLSNVNLSGALLAGANLMEAKNLTPEQVKSAQMWEAAIYDEDFHAKLGLKL